jgi:ATP-dependent helicase/nuclease subunit B
LYESARDLGLLSADRWDAWAKALEEMCRRHIDRFDGEEGKRPDPGAAAVREVLAGMHLMEEARCPFSRQAALRHFESALAETSVRIGSVGGDESARDNGGVRVLDAMQARGLTFDTVFLLGFNADLFPRRPREDPFLRDGDRRLLRERLKRPVPLKTSGREEEHLLLAHMLGCARSRIVLSWQRADESGRAKVLSLAFREVARVARGSAELEGAAAEARRVPTHPGESCRDAVTEHGFLPGPDALIGAALEIRSASKLREALERLGSLLPAHHAEPLDAGLAMMDAVEAFAPADLSYDALVDEAAAAPERWSPSRLETLGNCPQQYLFRHVLRVEELQEPSEAYETDLREIGERVHRILHGVYDRLIQEGDLSRPGADPKQAASRVMGLLNQAWAEQTLDLAERMHGRYPLYWKTFSDLWKNALLTFLLYDIAEMQGGRVRLIGLEKEASTAIDLGEGRELLLRGRFDRVVRGADGSLLLVDYKTGGNLERRVDRALILKGVQVQMPLYALMGAELASSWGVEGGKASAEVIGVGPAHAQEAAAGPAGAHGYPARAGLDPERFAQIREGFTETLRVLVDLAASGFFPLRKGSRCDYCPYDRACRRYHAPTVNRITSAPRAASFLLLSGKSTRAMTLSEVTRRAGGEEA